MRLLAEDERITSLLGVARRRPRLELPKTEWAEVEHLLDDFKREHPYVRIVRLRPALIFKRSAATGIRRLFAGPFLPGALLRPPLVPIVPSLEGLRFQAVHTDDVAEAYRQAI